MVDGGNFVTKVIYLPDPKYQELAVSGVETLVSTRLEPGVDPILEADKRGTILLIVRLGAIDLEMPGRAEASARRSSAAAGQRVDRVDSSTCGSGDDAAGHLPPGVASPAPAPGNVILDPAAAAAPAPTPPTPAPPVPPRPSAALRAGSRLACRRP